MKKKILAMIFILTFVFSSFLVTMTSSYESNNDDWVEYRIYNPNFDQSVLIADSWESWNTDSSEATEDDDSFWYWFNTYTIDIRGVQAFGYKHTDYNQIEIDYIRYEVKRGDSWSGGSKTYNAELKCDLASLFPSNCDTQTWTHSQPGETYTPYTKNWGEFFYYYYFPTRYTFRIDIRIQMRNGNTVKADVTSTVSWQSYDTSDEYV